jgi:hypothetical protein
MLTLYAPLNSADNGQILARFVKDGFKAESWNALAKSETVYEARITALPDPNTAGRFGSLLLCTLYEGQAKEYHRFFWDKLTLFFVLVALAAQDPPFTEEDLTPEQRAAFNAAAVLLLTSDAPVDPDPTREAQLSAARADALAKLPAAMAAVTAAMNKDDDAVDAGTLNVSKFKLFSNWVRKHDLTGSVGVPADGPENKDQDLRVAPVGSARNQFVAPTLPSPPWGLLVRADGSGASPKQ